MCVAIRCPRVHHACALDTATVLGDMRSPCNTDAPNLSSGLTERDKKEQNRLSKVGYRRHWNEAMKDTIKSSAVASKAKINKGLKCRITCANYT